MASELFEMISGHVDGGNYPFHMPGHKRNSAFCKIGGVGHFDITEIEGFDNYHKPTGVIQREFERAARVFGVEKSYYLVNGCSAGILAAISAVCEKGDKIAVARNCHKAVYNGIYLRELTPVYIYPGTLKEGVIAGEISCQAVRDVLEEQKDIKCVLITSPTYEGVVSDIEGIAKVCHEYGVVLIVDEAHGAHFGFFEAFPESARHLGADIVIEGLHKTMPSLTQTGIIHVNGELADIGKLERYISMYQTTSPSYIFMASISECICMIDDDGDSLFGDYAENLKRLRTGLKGLKALKLIEPDRDVCYNYDASKIVIYTGESDITGHELYEDLINKYNVWPEMSSLEYVVLMTTVCDKWEHYDVLKAALFDIDARLCKTETQSSCIGEYKNDIVLSSYDAMNRASYMLGLDMAEGQIAAEYVYVYPPGIPLLVPGERIDKKMISMIKQYADEGLSVVGLSDNYECIPVIKEKV